VLYDVSARNSRNAGGLSAPSASAALDDRDLSLSGSNVATISPRMVNETRAQITRSRLDAPPADAVGPSVTIAGVAAFGTMSVSPVARRNTLLEVVDSVSFQAGDHAFRAGANLLYNREDIEFPRAFRGAYTFASLENFLRGVYNNGGFTQTFGDAAVSLDNPNAGLFAQDEWKMHRSFTLNLGVRYDLQFLPTIATDVSNIAPRAGLAWSAGDRTVVRAGAGMYFDRVPLRPLANALLSANNTTDLAQVRQVIVGLSPGQAGAPVFPHILAAPVPLVTLVNLTTMDRHLQNAVSRQASAEIEHQFGSRTTVTATYRYLRAAHLLLQINQNVPTCVPSGGNNGCRPNPAYANNNQYSSEGRATTHALDLAVIGRPARWGSYRVSYTLAKAMNNVGEAFFSSPIDPGDLSKDWGRSDSDQRHRAVAAGSLNLPFAVQASAILQVYSALPLNVTSGATTVQGTAGRPLVNGQFISRNAGTGGDFVSLGARVSRLFRVRRVQVEASLEAFNLTNRRNVVARNGTFGTGSYPTSPSAAFNQVTAVGDPRSLQLGIRARF
jgi:hypothetical protein